MSHYSSNFYSDLLATRADSILNQYYRLPDDCFLITSLLWHFLLAIKYKEELSHALYIFFVSVWDFSRYLTGHNSLLSLFWCSDYQLSWESCKAWLLFLMKCFLTFFRPFLTFQHHPVFQASPVLFPAPALTLPSPQSPGDQDAFEWKETKYTHDWWKLGLFRGREYCPPRPPGILLLALWCSLTGASPLRGGICSCPKDEARECFCHLVSSVRNTKFPEMHWAI